MPVQGDEVRLRHMLEASRKAIELCRLIGRADLEQDEVRTLALTRLLEIIGEAAKNVSEASRSAMPDVPWRAIAGTRDRLIHGYFDVDLDLIWSIVVSDLPALVASLERRSPVG